MVVNFNFCVMVQSFDVEIIKDGFSRTIKSVEQIGFIDLRVAFATGVVPCDIDGVEGNFNGVENPASILGKPDDVFSAMRAAKAVESVSSDVKSPDGESAA